MPFANITALRNYVNTYIITNGVNSITGLEDNTAMNGFIQFIIESMVNNSFVRFVSTGGVVVLPAPMVFITTVLPTSIQWVTNFQNEYYIVNGLGVDVPLATGFSYIDQYQTVQTVIPARTAIHIAQATNGSWIQMNNVGGSGGGGGSLPPETGHDGQFLTTNGTTPNWDDPHITITSADFEPDGITYLNPRINVTNHVTIFSPDIPNTIYVSKGEWHYVAGGFVIDLPWFDASTNPNLILELYFKGINTP